MCASSPSVNHPLARGIGTDAGNAGAREPGWCGLLLLKGAEEAEPTPRGQPGAEVARPSPSPQKNWLCARCGRTITDDDARVEIDGSHVHTRINPVGVMYRFGCFDRADCTVSDRPTLDHTWFPGRPWQYAHCPGCALHLGWYFGGFFGLVLDRLARPE